MTMMTEITNTGLPVNLAATVVAKTVRKVVYVWQQDQAGNLGTKLALKHRKNFALKERQSKDSCASLSIIMSHEYSWQGPVMLAKGHMVPALHCIYGRAVGGGWVKQGC